MRCVGSAQMYHHSRATWSDAAVSSQKPEPIRLLGRGYTLKVALVQFIEPTTARLLRWNAVTSQNGAYRWLAQADYLRDLVLA